MEWPASGGHTGASRSSLPHNQAGAGDVQMRPPQTRPSTAAQAHLTSAPRSGRRNRRQQRRPRGDRAEPVQRGSGQQHRPVGHPRRRRRRTRTTGPSGRESPVISDQTKRIRIGTPSNTSHVSNSAVPSPEKRPSTGGSRRPGRAVEDHQIRHTSRSGSYSRKREALVVRGEEVVVVAAAVEHREGGARWPRTPPTRRTSGSRGLTSLRLWTFQRPGRKSKSVAGIRRPPGPARARGRPRRRR